VSDVMTSCQRTAGERNTLASGMFGAFKRTFDILFSFVLLPVAAIVAGHLLILNPWLNRGPLIYRQERMGRDCIPFTMYKFRSMVPTQDTVRGWTDPVEQHRITRLGRWLRTTRVDELPQILNVLKGEMSLIGPRPDALPHAQLFLQTVKGYRARHAVRPGISGLAQTQIGYVQGPVETRRKVVLDLYYIHNSGFRLELSIVVRTLYVVLTRS
jgi:lipopolysaccharide/colanic/teichoic acid biosynthesis glycosyltransferase